jgi:hypothetical protein
MLKPGSSFDGRALRFCIEVAVAHGRPRLTFSLPDSAALDKLTQVLARLLSQIQPGG